MAEGEDPKKRGDSGNCFDVSQDSEPVPSSRGYSADPNTTSYIVNKSGNPVGTGTGNYYRITVGTGPSSSYRHLVTFEYFKRLMNCLGYSVGIEYNNELKIEIARQIWDLNTAQTESLRKAFEYTTSNPTLLSGTTVFAFEGAGNVSSAWNNYHPYGEFNAMFVVMKDGEITYITKNGSTLPSLPERNRDNINGHAVLREDTYNIINFNHLGYSALKVLDVGTNSGDKLPVYRRGEKYNDANGVDIHAAGYSTNTHYSTGCITVAMSDYIQFGKQVGFINDNLNLTWNGTDSYSTFTKKIGKSHTEDFSGKFVLDRSVLRQNLTRDRGTARVSEDMYLACMKYYFGG